MRLNGVRLRCKLLVALAGDKEEPYPLRLAEVVL
jgi:hypothetical protein